MINLRNMQGSSFLDNIKHLQEHKKTGHSCYNRTDRPYELEFVVVFVNEAFKPVSPTR